MSELTSRLGRGAPTAVLVLFLLAMPLFLSDFWVQTGLFAMAAVVGAVGLTLLVGVTGQLSLGHAFFAAVGAYTYAVASGPRGDGGELAGLGLPTMLALALAVLVPALVGALFSPISGRLRGIYLGLATVGLVFLARHLLVNLEGVTGGFNGRSIEPLRIFGFTFSNRDPDFFALFGVPLEGLQRLWFMYVALVLVAMWLAGNLVRSRVGRAMVSVRDSEIAAAAAGVDVARTKAVAFIVSSGYAGLAGALMGLAFGRVAPDVFGIQLSIDFLIMIVLGGLASVRGAAAGAVLVVSLPLVLTQYGSDLPFLASPGSEGYDPATVSRIAYGVAIIGVLLFVRGGLAGLATRLTSRLTTARDETTAPGPDSGSATISTTAATTGTTPTAPTTPTTPTTPTHKESS